ncbi:MAG: 50S ribosome-binding GTPase [Acidobacteria bacterium]|nr:50S ribosome-binding GTPase [Acidobacteriota bacterium]
MRVHIVNPSHFSFGLSMITPRWLYVLAAATPTKWGDPVLSDEMLEPFDTGQLEKGDIIGIGIHTGNALVGYQRSIVLDVPGTTRDIVTAGTALDGWPVELADTAGLRANVGELEAAGQLGFDHEIETAGQQKARQQMDRADLVVLVFDSSRPWSLQNTALAEAWPNSLQVHNKCDLVSGKTDHRPGLQVSALSGEGVDVLVGELGRQLVPNPPPAGSAVPFTTEQVDSFVRATEAITAGETTVAAELLQKLGQ